MGGYKQSGIGRSMGAFGLEEYLEVKSIYGFEEEALALPLHDSAPPRHRHIEPADDVADVGD